MKKEKENSFPSIGYLINSMVFMALAAQGSDNQYHSRAGLTGIPAFVVTVAFLILTLFYLIKFIKQVANFERLNRSKLKILRPIYGEYIIAIFFLVLADLKIFTYWILFTGFIITAFFLVRDCFRLYQLQYNSIGEK